MSANALEILIQARDEASQKIQGIAGSIKNVDVAANAARSSLVVFGSAAITTGIGVARTFGGLRDVIQSVRDVLDSDTGKVFLEQISTLADDALSNLAPLSKVLKEIKENSKSFGAGLVNTQTADQANKAIFSDNGKRIDDILKTSANKFGKALEDSITASKLNRIIENELGIGAKELGVVLDEVVAGAFLEGIVDAAIPNALKGVVSQAFGVDLTAILTNTFRESAKTGFLTEISKQLAQGSFTGAAKTFAVGAIGPTLENIQKNAGQLSGSLGESVGRTLSGNKTESNKEFQILDEQLGGSFAKLINSVANRIPAIVDKLPLPPVAKLIATRLTQTTIDTGKNELQGVANNISSGLFSTISEKIPEDLKLLGTVLRPAFEIQKQNLINLAKNTLGFDIEGASGDFSKSLKNFASKAVDTIDGAIGSAIGGSNGGGGGASPLAGLASKVDDFFGSAFSEVLKTTGSTAGKSFIEGLQSTISAEIGSVVDRVDQIIVSTSRKIQNIAPQLQKIPETIGDAIGFVSGATEPIELFNIISTGAEKATGAIFEISQKLAFLGLGFQALQGIVQNGPFDLLIGQNARLQEQLISTQASLAATNKVLIDGQRVADPTQAITSLGSEVNGAIDNIRKASLELVGVTSKDLVGVFQIVAGQASNIGASLNDAANITTSVASALGTLGLPLFQARQEVVSITTGTIDQNSALAKNLNLNNEMVNKWKAQGTFVKELLTRLEAFKAGNKLAAQTIGGVTSNIQELVDEIGRLAGEKFLAPLVKELDGFYQYFAKNKDTIAKQVSDLAEIIFNAFTSLLATAKSLAEPFFQIFGQVPEYLFRSLVGAVNAFSTAIAVTIAIIKPAINVFEQVATVVGPLGGIWIGITVGAKVLAGAIGFLNKGFSLMFNLVPGLGEALFFLDKRSNGVVNTFINLSSAVGKGSAGFLLLGSNLNNIPGAAAFANKELAKLLGGFAPLSGVITSILPSISGFGVKLIGLTQAFPALGTALGGFAKAAPVALLGLSGIVGKSQLFGSFSPLIAEAAKGLSKFTNVATDTAKVNSIFSNSLKASGAAIKEFVGQTALLGVGTFVGFLFFDQLILKNKGLQAIFKNITNTIRDFADAIASFFGPIISAVSGFLTNLVGIGENSNVFNKITGGILAAIVVVKLFGGTITSVFSDINKTVAGTFDGISASIGKAFNLFKTINQVIFGGKEIASKFLETTEGKSATSSNLIDRGKTLRGALSDPTLSPEYRDAIKRQQEQLALDAKALKGGDANKVSTSVRKEVLNNVKADAETSIALLESQNEKLRNNRRKAEQLASADRKVVLDETKKFKRELGRVEAIQLGRDIAGTSTPESNKELETRRQELTKQIEESKKSAEKINATEAEKLKKIQALRDENTKGLAEYRNTLNTVNTDIANLTEASAKRVLTTEGNAARKRKELQAELKKIDSDSRLDKSLDLEKRQALLKQGLDAAKAKKLATSPEDVAEQQSRIDSAKKGLALQNPNQILGANLRKQEIQSELAGLKTYGEALTDIVDPTRKARLEALADLEKYQQKRKKVLQEIATVDAETGRSANGRSVIGLQSEVKSLDASIAEFEQKAERLQSPFKKAAKGLVSSFKNIFAELGPTLLIGAAFAAFTALFGYVSEQAKAATESSDRIAANLKGGLKRLDILAESQSKNASESLNKLTKDREAYVKSIRDPSILENDPTLKLYDQQIARLKQLKQLQSTPTDPDSEIRAEIDKRRAANPFQTGVVDLAGAINPFAPNYKEAEVQTLKAGEESGLATAQATFQRFKTEGLARQRQLESELKKLEADKNKSDQLGDKDKVAQIDSEIDAKKTAISEGKKSVDTLLEDVNASKLNSQEKKNLVKELEKLQKAYQNVGVTIAAIDLPRIGNAIEQASAKYAAAVDALNKAAGDPALFKTKLGELLEVSKELQDAGILRADEVSNQFARIATNVSADRDLQIKAQQAITEAYQKEAQRRVGIYDAQISQIKALQAQGKISESEAVGLTGRLEEKKLLEQLDAVTEANKAKKAILEKNAKEEKENIERDRKVAEARKAAATGDSSKVQKIREDLTPTLDKKRGELQSQIKEGDDQLKKLEDQLSKGEISGSVGTKKIEDTTLALAGLRKELGGIDDQKGKLDAALKLGSGTKEDLDKVTAEINSTEKELSLLKIRRDGAQKALTSGNTFGDQKGFEKTRDSLNQKIAELESAQRTRLEKQSQLQNIIKPDPEAAKLADLEIANQDKKEGDRYKNLLAQRKRLEEDANKERLEAESKYLEARANNAARQLDAQIKEALNKEKLGETQRLTELNKLRKSGIKLESEIRLLETGEKKRSIQLELNLEQQKQAKIAELKKSGKGFSQQAERDNLIKIAELTKSLTDTELEAINNLTSAIRDRLTLAANQYGVAIEKANLKLERQKLLYTALEKSLENQGRLADSSKKLSDSIVAVREADLNVLNKIYDKQQQAIRDAGGTGNFADLELEEKKKLLTEQMAKIKLESLLRQQTFEKESLEREIQKRDLLLERQKLENQIRTESAKVDLAIAQVDVKAAEAEVKLRPNSPEAKLKLDKARLEQQKKEIGFAGLIQEGGFLQETGRINKIQADQERTSLNNNQSAALLSGQGEFISAIRDDATREALLASFESQLRLRNGPQQGITSTEANELINRRPSQAQGASLTDPSKYGDVLKRTTANGTLTTEPIKSVDSSFATSFEELAKKYAPKDGLGSIEDLNKKYGGKDAQTFKELEDKYSGKPVTQETTTSAIASSFDSLNKQIDDGFTKVLVAPQLKVEEMTGQLEAEFNRISKQIVENPVQLKIDEKVLDDQLKKLEKPIAVLDETQLQRLEAIATALGVGGQNVNPQTAQNAGVGIGTTINAPITVNQQGVVGSVAGVDVKAGVRDALDTILKRVANVTSGTR